MRSKVSEIKKIISDINPKNEEQFRCGYIALAGRPNVGKSSLLNALLQTRLSIVSPKAQTTRHRILGINHYPNSQVIYMDLPGIHQASQYKQLNKVINRTAMQSTHDADILGFVIQSGKWLKEDEAVLAHLQQLQKPIIAIINKIDLHKDRAEVLPFIQKIQSLNEFAEIIPVSALKKWQIEHLEQTLIGYLPEQEALFEADQLTNRPTKFYVTEIIREALFFKLQKELPYGVEVYIANWDQQKKNLHLDVDLWIAKASYKSILLGKGGSMLTSIREMAEKNITRFLEQSVKLHCRVKLVEDWSTHANLMKQLGYEINR